MSREAYRKSAAGRARGSLPRSAKALARSYGPANFRLTCRRPRPGQNLHDLRIDPMAVEATWRRQGHRRVGTMVVNWPAGSRRIAALIVRGDVIRCEVQAFDGAPWRVYWEMSVLKAVPDAQAKTSELTLRSRLAPAMQSRSHWRYRKDRQHPRGWNAREVTISAAKRYRVPLGEIPTAKHRFAKLVDKSASVVELVQQAWTLEREWTGRRFDVSIARGRLDVVELVHPKYLLPLGPRLVNVVLNDMLPAQFASALLLTTTVKRRGSGKRKRIAVRVVNRDRVKRYGYIVRHVEVDKHGINTAQELRRHGQRLLARRDPPFKSATVTIPGVPWADRGHGVYLRVPELGIVAEVFTTDAEHRLSYGSYEVDLTLRVTDPWNRDERRAIIRQHKAQAREQRRRGGSTATKTRKKDARAKVRGA